MKFLLLLFAASAGIARTAVAQSNVLISTGTTFKTSGGVVITLENMNLVNDGVINQSPGEGTFIFSGNQDAAISGNNQPFFDIVNIAKNTANTLLLNRDISIGTSIIFTSGLIDLNTNHIFLQPAAVLNGETETSRITGINGGYMQIATSLNAPASADPGNLGAVITSSQNLGSTVIRRGHQSQTNGAGTGNSINRFYEINPALNTGLDATFRFNYFDAELNGLPEANLTFWKSPSSLLVLTLLTNCKKDKTENVKSVYVAGYEAIFL